MKKTEHQEHLWSSMIDLIDNYLKSGTEDFNGLVGKLEGALDTSGITDSELINEWYTFWTPLEIRRAIQGNTVERTQAVEDLKKMKEFILINKNWKFSHLPK